MRPFGGILPGFALVSVLAAYPAAAQKHQSADRIGSPSEDRVAREVRHELLMLPYYGVFDNLAFSVNGGMVTLFGQVTRPTLKSDAENVVKRIEGVTQVENKIQVLPLSDMDWQLRRAVFRAIYSEPSLNTKYAYQAIPPIHIIVDNGHVTLVGAVDSETDKNLAGLRANQTPGAFSVTNNLTVEK